MARAKVIHSEDAVTVVFNGDKASPEPSQGIIKFPGGHVEVSRCSDGSYWAHVYVQDPSTVVESRVDYAYPYNQTHGISDMPNHEHIEKLTVRVKVGNNNP